MQGVVCKNCGHEITLDLRKDKLRHISKYWTSPTLGCMKFKENKTNCDCTNPEPLEVRKFKIGDIVQLKEDIYQIACVEEIRENKYVYDFEGKSYIEQIIEFDKRFEIHPNPEPEVVKDGK